MRLDIALKRGNVVKAVDTAPVVTPLVTITQLRPIYVTFTVPERYLADLRAAQAAGRLGRSRWGYLGRPEDQIRWSGGRVDRSDAVRPMNDGAAFPNQPPTKADQSQTRCTANISLPIHSTERKRAPVQPGVQKASVMARHILDQLKAHTLLRHSEHNENSPHELRGNVSVNDSSSGVASVTAHRRELAILGFVKCISFTRIAPKPTKVFLWIGLNSKHVRVSFIRRPPRHRRRTQAAPQRHAIP